MCTIDIDAKDWRTPLDFYDAVLARLNAPKWHSQSVDALTESMVWGEINEIEPPYVIRLHHTANLPQEVIDHLKIFNEALAEARDDFIERRGYKVDAFLEIVD